MACNKINTILYVISGLCFSIILSSWIGNLKFMNTVSTPVSVQVTSSTDIQYTTMTVVHHQYCQVNSVVSWYDGNIITDKQQLIFKIDNNTEVVPVMVNYQCKFMIFKKNGIRMIYAIIE